MIQEESKAPPQKRLRLVHKVPPSEPPIDLHGCSSPQEVLRALVKFGESLPVSVEHAQQTYRLLVDYFYKGEEPFVRVKIASLLGTLVKTPGLDVSCLFEDFAQMMKTEKSHKVLTQLVSSLIEIGKTIPQNVQLHAALVKAVKPYLAFSCHLLRCKCLDLIGALGVPEKSESDSTDTQQMTLQEVLAQFSHDTDPRVRSTALQAILEWHQRGLKLKQSVYEEACKGLKDDFEGVRLAAVKLVWVLSQIYPESLVKVSDSELRLVDDGFAHICDMVNDVSMKVRAEAASRLGSLHAVSSKFLDQTLDKKLMSNMRRKRSAHERQKELYECGEWSTGQKWADDAPKEELRPEAVSMMSGGACGAFVHGLEDEFLEVRNAAIDSVCELACQSERFAALSQDFLVDMFNDEIQTVRLNAINSLRKICQYLLLREDQLEIILGALKDSAYEIRESLREMFCSARLGTKACLCSAILGLLDNMRRYPQDRISIWKCMQKLGRQHPALTLPMVPDLLSIHPHFEAMEPDLDDPAYISILILVFNAALDCPTMPPLFPAHIYRHYAYLRDTLPDVVPALKLPGAKTLDSGGSRHTRPTSPNTFLRETLERLQDLATMDADSAQQLMQMGIRDLERVQEVEPSLSATAECLAMYLQCQLYLAKALESCVWSSPTVLLSQQNEWVVSGIEKVLTLSQHMEHVFLGLGEADVAAIKQLRLRAQTLQLLRLLQGNLQGGKLACLQYLRILNDLQRLFATSSLQPDSFTKALLADLHKLESCDPGVYLNMLRDAISLHKPCALSLVNQVQKATVTILEPTGTSDNVIKFTSGLAVAVNLIADIQNVQRLQDLRIQVKYPDQKVQESEPKASDYKWLNSLNHRLMTEVILSHGSWSESCPVEILICKCYTLDREITTDKAADNPTTGVIELTPPVKVLLCPKPPKT